MRDLPRRTVTALVYGAVVLATLFAPWPTFAVLVAILAVLGYLELRTLFSDRSFRPSPEGVVFVLLFVVAHVYAAGSPRTLTLLTLAVLAVAFSVAVYWVVYGSVRRGRPDPTVLGAVFTVAGALYLGFAFGFLIELWLARDDATRTQAEQLFRLPVWLLLAVVPTWAADVAAYVVGARFGRRKIAPRISPGKTWEGTLAGFAAAAVVELLLATSVGIQTGLTLLLAGLVGPVGFAGDLLESAIKRAAGAKDSGTLLPGHGGVLDRIDSLMLVAPAVTFVFWLARGASL